MGICSSCESTSVATAKLIHQDGRLQEFSYPVKVGHVLQRDPTCFICNSDEMEFDDVVSAISDDEELQPGQLYFVLPLSRLKHPLQAEEMAALAVKASSAMTRSGDKCGCGRKPLSLAEYSGEKSATPTSRLARDGGFGGRRSSGSGGRMMRNFEAKLSAIPE